MRDQMENVEYEKRSALQQAAAEAQNEMQGYLATIRALREEMELLIESHTTKDSGASALRA